MKIYAFSLKFVPKGPINNIPALVQIMAWCRPGDKPLSEPVSLLTHIFFTQPQWAKHGRANPQTWTQANNLWHHGHGGHEHRSSFCDRWVCIITAKTAASKGLALDLWTTLPDNLIPVPGRSDTLTQPPLRAPKSDITSQPQAASQLNIGTQLTSRGQTWHQTNAS